MYCTQCGLNLEDQDLFCSKCGNPTRPGYSAWNRRPPLSRPMDQKKIAGVCAGFARHMDSDVTLMRILWLAGALVTGGVLAVAYLVAWVLMPRDYAPASPERYAVADQG